MIDNIWLTFYARKLKLSHMGVIRANVGPCMYFPVILLKSNLIYSIQINIIYWRTNSSFKQFQDFKIFTKMVCVLKIYSRRKWQISHCCFNFKLGLPIDIKSWGFKIIFIVNKIQGFQSIVCRFSMLLIQFIHSP